MNLKTFPNLFKPNCDPSKFWNKMDIDGIEPYGILKEPFYATTENLLTDIFDDYSHIPSKILDIGSGTGRWIDWYQIDPFTEISGVEPCKKWHNNYPDIEVFPSIFDITGEYDTINAIGVMHHILSNSERIQSIKKLLSHMKADGLFIISGMFPRITTPYSYKGEIYKKCWSKRRWIKLLKDYHIKFYPNRSFYHHNILIIKQES